MLFITSIEQILTKEFIIGLGSNTSTGSSIASALKGGGQSSADKVSVGLRRGAGIYAKAIGNLNTVGAVLNTAQALMEDLGKITDKMIVIVERATKASTTNSTRAKLDQQFKKLVNDFRETVENAKIDDKEILTKEGLQEFFINAGLDPEKSKKIAAVFDNFVLPKEEDVFASEEIKGGALKLPAAQNAATPSPTYFMNQVSHDTSGSGIVVGGIASNTNIFLDDSDYVGQNPVGVVVPFLVNESGNIQSIPTAPSGDIQVMAVSENTGYSVIRSSEDLLGFGFGSGTDHLFIMAPDGSVVHQISTDDAGDFSNVDIGYGNGTKIRVSFVSSQNFDGISNLDLGEEVFYYEFAEADFGSDPSGAPLPTQITSGSAGAAVTIVKINEDGTYLAYNYNDGTNQIKMYEVSSGNSGSINNAAFVVGFSDSDTIITAGPTRFNTIDYATPALTSTLVYIAEGGSMPSYANSAVSEQGYLAYYSSTDRNVYITNITAPTTEETIVRTLDVGDTVNRLTVAGNNGSTVDVGIFGTIRAFDSSRAQLYRIREIQANTIDVLTKPAEVDKIFDGNIRRREDAFRTLNDLKALSEQIDDNIGAIEDTLVFLQQNIDLVRATGLSFLELSEKIKTDKEADDVARLVELEVRNSAPQAALAQAENLSPIAVAALLGLDN